MKKILFIINPIAGTFLRQFKQKYVESFLSDSSQYYYEVKTTEYKGHEIELTQYGLANNFDTLVVAGGDGTVNAVVTQLLYKPIDLLILPTGSGNGVAHHLKLPFNIQKGIHLLKTGVVLPVDVGQVENQTLGKHYFLSNCGFGYDAEVIHSFSKIKARGFFAYFIFLVQAMFTLRPQKAIITIGEERLNLMPFVFTMTNSSFYGYKIEVVPHASMSDGFLDTLLVRDATKKRILKFAMASLLKKTNQINDVAEYRATKSIQIEFPNETKLQIDGEPKFVKGRLNVQILKQALNVIVPAHNPEVIDFQKKS